MVQMRSPRAVGPIRRSGVCLIALAGWATCAHAGVVWNELPSNDLSNDRLNPSGVVLSTGDNQLFGDTGVNPDGSLDRDFLRITIPSGLQLSQIVVQAWVSADFAAFIGMRQGPVFDLNPDEVSAPDLFGWDLFGPFDLDNDILVGMANSNGNFTAPLGPGDYTFWIQQTGESTQYVLNFVTIPTPGALAMLGAAGLLMTRRRR